ncbi:TetR/AcrR family transcriptional regulator [Waterburya agarophytonicola K14]|uniref:TetR/AcrR family transcriptional regulator n=1 Tax=Waterburya agarophytonicola KI4 TaxID=2874699 RepID=A0A964BQQ4_9CYAN|nr:TetR/AcrR family transcriptional regulator [Waterburya agarophytonicola]MCC0176798.1 TetR/AcrR family transcriptional regulator [Waterburya agarophytonicola KI4]
MVKEELIAKLIPIFRHYGYEGATVSRLSKATGLKKASLYHHFQGGKEQMAEAVLEYTASWLEENIFAPLQSELPAQDRIILMIGEIDRFYARGKNPCLLAVMSLGEADDLFHQQLQQSLKKWLDTLAKIVEETGVESRQARLRAEDAMIMIQGALVLVRVTNDTQPFQRAIAKLPQILLEN